jgi:cytochrome bd-type quinol oxidase subunit 2
MDGAYPKSAMTPRRCSKAFPFLPGAAFAGVVVAHGLAYLLAFPQGLLRQQVLAESGHSYWAAAVALAMVCALVASLTTIAEHVGRGIRHDRPRNPWELYRAALIRLAALQSAVFVLQEVLERVRAGAPVSELLHGNFLAIGLAMQLIVAVLIALVLTLLGVTGEAIGRALSKGSTRRTIAVLILPAREIVRAAVAVSSDLPRAPPGRSVSPA